MTILTPEIIEKAARAINPHVWDKAPGANWQHDVAQMMAIADATAALEAALPSLVEATWRDAINLVVLCGPPGSEDLRDNLIARMKTRIRSLLNKEDQNGR